MNLIDYINQNVIIAPVGTLFKRKLYWYCLYSFCRAKARPSFKCQT